MAGCAAELHCQCATSSASGSGNASGVIRPRFQPRLLLVVFHLLLTVSGVDLASVPAPAPAPVTLNSTAQRQFEGNVSAYGGEREPEPEPGQTVLIIGQNWVNELDDYEEGTLSTPAGASLYTFQLFQGEPLVIIGDGMDFLLRLNDMCGNDQYHILISLAWKFSDGGCARIREYSVEIANGLYDSQLEEFAALANSMPGLTFLLRPEYEVGYQEFTCQDPTVGECDDDSYQRAFQHIAAKMSGVANVQLVFHVAVGEANARCLYPGDDAVDVFGVSFFENRDDACYRMDATCVDPNIEATFQWARDNAPQKPLIIPESSPLDMTTGDAAWPIQFLEHVQSAIVRHDIRYWAYINQDWLSHDWPASEGWGDTRVQAPDRPELLTFWRNTVLDDPRYICARAEACSSLPLCSGPDRRHNHTHHPHHHHHHHHHPSRQRDIY